MADSTNTLSKTVTAELSPPYIEKTGERRYTETYVKAKYYTCNVTASGDSLVFDTLGAIGFVFTTNKTMTPGAVAMNADGTFPDGNTAHPFADGGDGEASAWSTAGATQAGWVSGSIMPPAIVLTNGNAVDATVHVFITYPTR